MVVRILLYKGTRKSSAFRCKIAVRQESYIHCQIFVFVLSFHQPLCSILFTVSVPTLQISETASSEVWSLRPRFFAVHIFEVFFQQPALQYKYCFSYVLWPFPCPWPVHQALFQKALICALVVPDMKRRKFFQAKCRNIERFHTASWWTASWFHSIRIDLISVNYVIDNCAAVSSAISNQRYSRIHRPIPFREFEVLKHFPRPTFPRG